jgi:choline dehydrogenase-like flavoprotein
MPTSPTPQRTDFAVDVLGRYVCNGLDEALRSQDSTVRPDARPFDVVILGGGSFGITLAQHLFNTDTLRTHRILVLEGGPVVLPEHVQNLPMIGLNVPTATTVDPGVPRNEVWGLPWRTSVPGGFPGLAYCLGGRSLFFGGWAPQLLDTATDVEMPHDRWPASVRDDLNHRYFREAAEQIGTAETNDFIFGELQNALRQQLFGGLQASQVTGAVPLGDLPDHPSVPTTPTPTKQDLLSLLGLAGVSGAPQTVADLRNLAKLEPPLAVQGRAPRSGFFPLNKFSAAPLAIAASRTAENECGGDDVRKRLMIVPNCHVQRLVTSTNTAGEVQVTDVLTNQGTINLPPEGVVVLALGTIESARLALTSFPNLPHAALMGTNLIAHLRSNLTIRIPRSALAALPSVPAALQESALFVKGRHTRADGSQAHYHLQISAAGLDARGADSEAELFKNIPDIDTLHFFQGLSADHVIITIRGIGEMQSRNPASRVALGGEMDEYGLPRGFVSLVPTAEDGGLWDTLDQASDDVARVFAAGQAYEVLAPGGFRTVAAGNAPGSVVAFAQRHDGLGTTHHEAGTLALGTDPASSVVGPDLRFHEVANAYAVGPAVLPSTGSPNPMLSGVALARRLGDRLGLPLPPSPAPQANAGFMLLIDGTSLANWRMSTIANQPGHDIPGRFVAAGNALVGTPGSDLGLLWCTIPMPADFILKLEWRSAQITDNSGVFIRFPNPETRGYNNTAWVGVDYGFEIQIDQRGMPDGAPIHKTGAIYDFRGPSNPNTLPVRPLGEWNQYEIRVQGQSYQVSLNGQPVTNFTFAAGSDAQHPERALPSTPAEPRYIGLQTHTGRVAFRNIQASPVSVPATPLQPAIVTSAGRA